MPVILAIKEVNAGNCKLEVSLDNLAKPSLKVIFLKKELRVLLSGRVLASMCTALGSTPVLLLPPQNGQTVRF